MAENRYLTYSGDEEEEEYGEECGILYRKKNLTVSSDINKKLLKKETWKVKKVITKKPNVKLASVNAGLHSVIDMIDTYDRPGDAYAEGTYARAGTYGGKRIPKAGFCAEAGVGRARAEFSVFEAEAKGPNASAGAEIGAVEVGAMARAELGSIPGKAGPVVGKLGLGLDTGASVGVSGFEAKFLGTGFSIGPKTSVSLVGSEVSCAVM